MAHTTRTCRATVLVCMVIASMVAAVHARGHKAGREKFLQLRLDGNGAVREIKDGVAQLSAALADVAQENGVRALRDAVTGLAETVDAFSTALGEAQDVALAVAEHVETLPAMHRSAAIFIKRSKKKAQAGLYEEAQQLIDMALEMFVDAKHELISRRKRAEGVARKVKLGRARVKGGVNKVRKEADATMSDAAKNQRGALGKLAEAGAVGAGLGLVAGPVGQLVGGAAGFGAAAVAVGLAAAFNKHESLEAQNEALQLVQVHAGGVVAILDQASVGRFADEGVAAVSALITNVGTVTTKLDMIRYRLIEMGNEIIDGQGGDDRVLQALMAEYDGVFEQLAQFRRDSL